MVAVFAINARYQAINGFLARGGRFPVFLLAKKLTPTGNRADKLVVCHSKTIMKPFDKDIVAAKFQEVGLIEFSEQTPV